MNSEGLWHLVEVFAFQGARHPDSLTSSLTCGKGHRGPPGLCGDPQILGELPREQDGST